MTTITTTDVTNGTLTDASVMNANFGAVKTVVNGNIDNSNISASAAIALSKLAQSGATTGQAMVWNGSAWAPDDVSSTSSVVSQTDPAWSLASSVAETEAWSYALPGNTLNATDYLRITIPVWVLNNTGGAVAHDLRFKIDGTTVGAALNSNLASNAAYQLQLVVVHIWPYSTSNIEILVRHERSSTAPLFATNDALAFTTTGSRTLSLTVQLGSSSANHAAKLKHVTVELLKAA